MTSTLQKPVIPYQNSRPNSASGSSATTVHRANSFTSRNGSTPRTVPTGLRPPGATDSSSMNSPELTHRSFSPEVKKKSPDQKRRSSALYTRPSSRHGGDEGVSNLNRWSQSTASSNTSQKRRSSFSKRLSGSLGPFGSFGSTPPAASPNAKGRKRSPARSTPPVLAAKSPMPANPPPVLPPIVALSSLSQAVDDADSPSTLGVATPATADVISSSSGILQDPDYFGDRWKSGSPNSGRTKRKAEMPSSRANPPSPLVFGSATSPGSKLPESVYSPRAAARSKEERRRHQTAPKQRSRASTGTSSKSNATTEGESSASDHREYHGRQAKRRAPSQKALLSKALAKANHAVVLDGKANLEGAILAYGDACTLLRQVMIRSSGDDDRRKLEAVRNTYKNRIVELRNTDPHYQSSDGKALPDRPAERESQQTSLASERLSIVTDGDNQENGAETTRSTNVGHDSGYGSVQHSYYADARPYIPPRRQSLQPFTRADSRDFGHTDDAAQQYSRRPSNTDRGLTPAYSGMAMYEEDIPPPLTPRRPLSPVAAEKEEDEGDEEEMEDDPARKNEAEHTSWLNTIAESSGSDQDSVHSRRASYGVRRKYIRNEARVSGQTEADFDAALDAAIETAYDDGFEPDDEDEGDEQAMDDAAYPFSEPKPEILSNARRNVELAKQNVREAEREAAIAQAKQHERMRLAEIARLQEAAKLDATRLPEAMMRKDSIDMEYGDDEAEEEERMLEEMTKDYILDDDEHDNQRKSALPQPRQSGSSGFSGKTWTSSAGSNPTSAGTSLSTVAEASVLPSMASQLEDNPLPPPVHPPPLSALPPPPEAPTPILQQPDAISAKAPGLAVRESSPSVRDRRLSGMKATQLRVETYPKGRSTSDSEAPKTQPPPLPPIAPSAEPTPEQPKSAFIVPEFQQTLSSATSRETLSNSATLPGIATRPGSRKGSSPYPGWEAEMSTSTLTKVTSQDSDASGPSVPSSPARFGTKAATGLRKNFSSSSLRNKSLSINTGDQDASPNTSVSSVSSIPNKRIESSPAMPVMPTPLEASFLQKGLSSSSGGIYLFDCDIHSPISPGSPNPQSINPPLPLEPCPESTLLRPFWLLRSIYQTIANPRGGYITSRLFVPRDIWRVKNIKLKNVEEKVSSCDLLTAALLKLNKVDTLNADAVLEEMQFLEGVMDQVQANLSKKLGGDVGVQGAASSFKGITVIDDSASNSEALTSKTNNPNSKSYLSSWRKLRSKNSLGPGLTTVSATTISKDGSKEAPTMKSLPMTTVPNPRFPKRDISQVQCMGPNPSYMGALARLCDAAQVLDQITRQVEDPGLKHSSQTHVGLELSARHAAEFFAFYICRFVFADIGLMLDKFIKRGSEWVLA